MSRRRIVAGQEEVAMQKSPARNSFHAILPILGTSTAFASVIGAMLIFGTVTMTMM
jgi:hypothetical protein